MGAFVTIGGGRAESMRHLGVGQGGVLKNEGRLVGLNAQPLRYELNWVAGNRGKPGINGDIISATEALNVIADPNFEIIGSSGNQTSALCTHNAEGGLLLTTAGADGDDMIIAPHLDANQTAWKLTTWGTDRELEWECWIETGAAITTCIIWAGLKLTNTPVVATDANQVFFRYEDDVNSGKWQAVSSIADTDDAADAGVAAVVLATKYHLKIVIDDKRVARMYIDDVLVKTTAALTDTTDFIPYIGIEEDGASSARTLYVYGQAISRSPGA